MDLHTLLTFVNVFALGVILGQSLLILNRMTPNTPHPLRLAYTFAGLGAFAGLLSPEVFTNSGLLMAWAVAYLISTVKPESKDITGVHKALFF